ncbi:MFS transporter [Luteococcus sanguinis]|uniref:MFS transporter n=1 Tax=Luteococcus sanguinis TaxID=174038 RepID=A0ABW1X3M4_9ACTN
MDFSAYRRLWAIPVVRNTLLVGVLSRLPQFAMGLVLTLHVVGNLDDRYSAAGVVAGVFTVAAAIAGPWRGHLLDRHGLRRTLVPSVAVLLPVWAIAPFVGYWVLLGLIVVAGAMTFPVFSVVRQVLVTNVPPDLRRSALSLDSAIVELSFMAGPALGVMACQWWNPRWVLLVCAMGYVAGSTALLVLNPPIANAVELDAEGAGSTSWLGLRALAILLAVAAAGFVLSGTDLAIVASLRDLGHASWVGIAFTLWGLGSAIGGITYGAISRSIPTFVLVFGLGITTAPLAFAHHPALIAVLLVLTGLFCAPSLASSVDELSALIPASARGQVMGWHGSAATAGNAMAPPLVGWAMDSHGWAWGYVVTGMMGVVAALVLMSAVMARRTIRRA